MDDLRVLMRRRRRQLGVGAQCRASQQLLKKITALPAYRRSRHIALYLSSDGEVSCREIIKHGWRHGKKCYLPVLAKDGSGSMAFVRYTPFGLLAKNRYGIAEPRCGRPLVPSLLDMVVVPLVAFDGMGNRVGMGGGFYDRTFAFRRCQLRPVLIGAAHRLQRVQRLRPQIWDVSLDGVVAV